MKLLAASDFRADETYCSPLHRVVRYGGAPRSGCDPKAALQLLRFLRWVCCAVA
jgi:hypothetical protein